MWTWEKILKCGEIKRGVLVESKFHEIFDGIVLGRINDSKLELIDNENIATDFCSGIDYSDFKFFNLEGEEILPPKERETITLYETMSDFSDVRMCDENGFLPNFETKKMVIHHNDYSEMRKANINKNKSVVIYADTFEVKEWRNLG